MFSYKNALEIHFMSCQMRLRANDCSITSFHGYLLVITLRRVVTIIFLLQHYRTFGSLSDDRIFV